MATVKDVFLRAGWEKTAARLIEHYDDVEKDLDGYRHAFEIIAHAEQIEDPDGIVAHIELAHDDDGHPFYHVFGLLPGDDEQCYSLAATTLAAWAGYRVADEVLASFPPEDAAAHFLWEATFYGYTDEQIQAFWKEVKRRLKEAKDNSDAWIPFEEVLEEFMQG